MKRAHAQWLLATAAILLCLAHAGPARAFEWFDGRLQAHGFFGLQLRYLSDNFDARNWYFSQWANQLNLEIEADIAPDGFGPFDLVTGFARVELRFECAFSGCGIAGSYRHFGDRAERAPASNWRDGVTGTFTANSCCQSESRAIHGGSSDLLTIFSAPLLTPLVEAGATNLDGTLAPIKDDLFAFKRTNGTREDGSTQLGPWSTRSQIQPIGVLRDVPNVTAGLPMRPSIGSTNGNGRAAQGLYIPSKPLLDVQHKFGPFDQNFTQESLQWNHGAAQQDTYELKELYLDFEMFDSRLWVRAGLQNIVWGKTELFRTTDNFNPQDIGLSSLPSLEESRIALWAVRAVWSLYDVGPLQDVRIEVAANVDDFEPTDLGRCGEPYTVWLVCGKSLGLWGHGALGLGLAGEIRPPDPWNNVRGVEIGGRLEWRWERFSFALTDYWGYVDGPVLEAFNYYSRNVDPRTGRPLDVRGEPLTPGNAREMHPGNRQFFDVACSATVGIAGALLPALEDSCVLDLLNSSAVLPGLPPAFPFSPASAIGEMLSGTIIGEIVGEALANPDAPLGAPCPAPGFGIPNDCRFAGPLNIDVNDGPSDPRVPFGGVSVVLTDQQEALLGCGPYYQTNCDFDGIDLFNAEASVLIQAFPHLEPNAPVGTRLIGNVVRMLPGSRGPGDRGYDPRIDGCVGPGHKLCAGASVIRDNRTGRTFRSEMEAISLNFGRVLALLSIAGGDEDCDITTLRNCGTVDTVLAVTGVQRPDIEAGGNGQYGRRDFFWHGGGQALLRYPKVNTFGLSADFAEDVTKTNWNMEFTWVADAYFGSYESRSQNQRADVFNLTVSMDRPTFINFLNANRTFFFNTQWFFQWIPEHDKTFTSNGPLNVLFTMAVATGYFQDRLLPSAVLVYDVGSGSGGILPSITYRFDQDFSITFGVATFWGNPQKAPVSLHQLALANNGGDFNAKTAYRGLSAIKERDEVFLRMRYTF